MKNFCARIKTGEAELFTVVCLPEETGKFPTVVFRSPYVDGAERQTDEEVAQGIAEGHRNFTDAGYAVVFQHCRGRGKSTGDCVAYIYEREDGLFLREWIREQSFYNGEIYLCGGSYTASVHYVTAPFEKDVKGAVFNVQDQNRYNCNYRNGFYKLGHGGWMIWMYKHKTMPKKNYVHECFNMLPLSALSKRR